MPFTGLKVAKKPCKECPFRKKCMPGWLGGGLFGQAVDYLRLAVSNLNEPCHMSPGFRSGGDEKMRPCAGLAIFRHNVGVVPESVQARDAIAQVVTPNAEVFATKEEFLAHHRDHAYAMKHCDRKAVEAVYPQMDIFIAKQGEHVGKYMVCSSNDSNIPMGVGDTLEKALENAKELLIGIKLNKY